MKEYKVLKGFDGLEAGNVLKYDADSNTFWFTKKVMEDNYSSQYTLRLSNTIVENYAKAGWLEAVVEDEVPETDDFKLRNLQDFIAKQKKFYQDRNERMQRKFENGKIQACVKLEHDTVYFNMMKLLNKIESIVA